MKYTIFLSLILCHSVFAKTYYITNDISQQSIAQNIYHVEQWDQLIARIEAGSSIHFFPGHYYLRKKLSISNLNEISIDGKEATLDFQKKPIEPKLLVECKNENCKTKPWQGEIEWIPQYVSFTLDATIEIVNSQNITISGFQMTNSWPNSVAIYQASQNIKIRHLKISKGTNAIYIEGPKIKNIIIENNIWDQDPTTKMWDEFDWSHTHHGKLNYLNGAFVQTRNIFGDIIIRNNSIRNAFNGIRMKVSREFCPMQASCNLNKNVKIISNQFTRIADNVIEPEYYAEDWIVSGNYIRRTYAPFSFDGVKTQNFQITNNLVEAIEIPRTKVSKALAGRSLHQGSRLFKFKLAGDKQLEHVNLLIADNEFNTMLLNTKKKMRLLDASAIAPGISIRNNLLCHGIRFNRNIEHLPSQLVHTNEIHDCVIDF